MLLEPIFLSLKVACLSTAISLVLGTGLAYVMARKKVPARSLWETLLLLPMILPPSVLGYLLLVLLGRRSPIGSFLAENFQLQIIFTWGACVIAAVVVSLPLMYQSIKSAFLSVDTLYEQAAQDLGANKRQTFFRITRPLAGWGILSGIILTFARSLGEFGATLMVAGNIPGKTQTMATAIYFAVDTGNRQLADTLVLIMTAFSFTLVFLLNFWIRRRMAE